MIRFRKYFYFELFRNILSFPVEIDALIIGVFHEIAKEQKKKKKIKTFPR